MHPVNIIIIKPIINYARFEICKSLDTKQIGLWNCANEDVRLAYLPPYSPELNPIERVWKITRKESTHNRFFQNLEELKMAVVHRFARWTNGSEVLRRLCAVI